MDVNLPSTSTTHISIHNITLFTYHTAIILWIKRCQEFLYWLTSCLTVYECSNFYLTRDKCLVNPKFSSLHRCTAHHDLKKHHPSSPHTLTQPQHSTQTHIIYPVWPCNSDKALKWALISHMYSQEGHTHLGYSWSKTTSSYTIIFSYILSTCSTQLTNNFEQILH